jgi:hypothetical protein
MVAGEVVEILSQVNISEGFVLAQNLLTISLYQWKCTSTEISLQMGAKVPSYCTSSVPEALKRRVLMQSAGTHLISA